MVEGSDPLQAAGSDDCKSRTVRFREEGGTPVVDVWRRSPVEEGGRCAAATVNGVLSSLREFLEGIVVELICDIKFFRKIMQ